MRPLLTLILKDLRRRVAEPTGVVISLVIPLAIAGTMALALGNRGDDQGPQLRLLVLDLDESALSGLILGSGQNPEAARRMQLKRVATREEGLRLLKDEEFTALLIIPERFSQAFLGGEKAELELIKNPAQTIMPIVAEQGVEVVALYLSGAAKLLGDDATRLLELFEGKGWNDVTALTSLVTAVHGRARDVIAMLFPPIIEVKTADKEKEAGGGFDWMSWMYPGMVVMGLIFTGLTQMRDLLREREAGTLRRLLVTPVSVGQVLLAKMLSVAAVVIAATVILLAVGSLAFGIRWGSPVPLIAVSVCLALAVTGFSALLFSLVRTERQGDAFGGILTMLMSLLGGAFIPPQLMPDWLAGLSRFTLNYWGNESLRALPAGEGWAALAGPAGVLAVFGLVTTGLGMLFMRRRHLQGAL